MYNNTFGCFSLARSKRSASQEELGQSTRNVLLYTQPFSRVYYAILQQPLKIKRAVYLKCTDVYSVIKKWDCSFAACYNNTYIEH